MVYAGRFKVRYFVSTMPKTSDYYWAMYHGG